MIRKHVWDTHSKCLPYVNTFNLQNILKGGKVLSYPLFIDEETEAQRGTVTGPQPLTEHEAARTQTQV